MKLYPKNLRNINDLERERALLLKKKKKMLKEGVLLSGKQDESDEEDGSGIMGTLLQFAGPLAGMLKDVVLSKFAKKENNPEVYHNPGAQEEKGKSFLRSVAIEFIGGYLKWKAIELSFKGIRRFLKSRKSDRV